MRNKTISLASFDSKSQDSDLDPEYSFGSGTADSRYVDLDKFVALRNQYDSKIADLNKKCDRQANENETLQETIKDLEKALRESRKNELKAEQKSLEFYEIHHKSLAMISAD